MIIFDLDGTLANCDHRRHFVENNFYCDHWHKIPNHPLKMCENCNILYKNWKPDWEAFNEACDKDEPNRPIVDIFNRLNEEIYGFPRIDLEIWSGRSESVRKKTEIWLKNNVSQSGYYELKMRPIGNYQPEWELKEFWFLDEIIGKGRKIDMVFEQRKYIVDMWRRRGITCLQVASGDF